MHGSSFTWCIWGTVLPVSIVIPRFFIKSKPSSGFVFSVVTKIFSSFCFSPFSIFATVVPSKCIRLSFTSLYYVSKGRNGVIFIKFDFGISVSGEPLSKLNSIGRLITNAVIVENSTPMAIIDRVECIFCFYWMIVFSVQSYSPAQLVSPSITWFTFLFARQHLAKWPIFLHFAHFFPRAVHSC